MIVHEGVVGDADAAFLAMRFEEAEEVFAIGVTGEDGLAVIAALGEMEPVSGEAKRFLRAKVVLVPPFY